nr:hypothetical protein [Endozoicomonas sp.]
MRHLIISERVEALECQGAALVIRREQGDWSKYKRGESMDDDELQDWADGFDDMDATDWEEFYGDAEPQEAE